MTAVRERGGRFLDLNTDENFYFDIGDREATEKVGILCCGLGVVAKTSKPSPLVFCATIVRKQMIINSCVVADRLCNDS